MRCIIRAHKITFLASDSITGESVRQLDILSVLNNIQFGPYSMISTSIYSLFLTSVLDDVDRMVTKQLYHDDR